MAFANLTKAATGCLSTMLTRYAAGTLKANLTAFCNAISTTFPDDNPNLRTVGNWLVLIQALTAQLTGAFTSADDKTFTSVATAVYRICWQADARSNSGQISAAQAAVVLAAMNANLA